MTENSQAGNPFAPAISFWCSLWQSQLEQNLRMWSYWASFMPHESAREFAAEAEALKPVVRTSPSRAKAAPKPSAASGAKSAPKTAAAAPTKTTRTAPAAKAKAKAGSEEPAPPTMH